MHYKHHVIPLHEWKRRVNPKATRYNREFNASDNVVWLTLEQHIECHKRMAEDGSKWDKISYLRMIGQIGNEEARLLAVSEANKRRTTKERKNSARKMIGNRNAFGHRNSIEVRKVMSENRKKAWITQKQKDSPLFCEHANECPSVCPCPKGCWCNKTSKRMCSKKK